MKGVVIALYGPDGTGKSAVASQLEQQLPTRVVRMHHRPRFLPRSSDPGDPTQPHIQAPRGLWPSVVKTVYVYADYLLGWWTRVAPAKRHGHTVILERGWWDMAVDPRRYRLSGVAPLVSALGHLLPKPDVNVVLFADPEVLLHRKQELSREELARQLAQWRTVGKATGSLFVDCSVPLATVLETILAATHTAPIE